MVQKETKRIAGPGEAGYQTCIKPWPMVEHVKKVFWYHHTLHQQLSLEEQPSRHKESHTVAEVFRHKKNYHYYGHHTIDVGDSVRNYCIAFYGCHGSNCTEDKDAIQKYLSTDRKWEIHLQGQSHFYVKLSQMQDTYKN